jgi:hypothetical protein
VRAIVSLVEEYPMCRPTLIALLALAIIFAGVVSSPGREAPAEAIKAVELTKELAKDEKATKAKYKGKTLVVEGKVVQVETDPDKVLTLWLAGHNEKDKNAIRVVCRFPADLEAQIKKVKKGDTVRVRGEFFEPGSSLSQMEVSLFMCEFAK